MYIQSVDLDDFSGSCKCSGDDGKNTFPSTSVIASAIQGKEAHKLTKCKKFGKPWIFLGMITSNSKNVQPSSIYVIYLYENK